jgi:hypothetical protein
MFSRLAALDQIFKKQASTNSHIALRKKITMNTMQLKPGAAHCDQQEEHLTVMIQ